MTDYSKTVALVSLKEYQEKLEKTHRERGHNDHYLILQEAKDEKDTIIIYITASSLFKENIESNDEEALSKLTQVVKEVSNANLRLNRTKKFVMAYVTNNSLVDYKAASNLFYNLEGTIMSVDRDYQIISDTIDTDGLQTHLTEALKNIKKSFVEIARVKVNQAIKGRVRVDLTIFTKDQATSGTVCLTNSEHINGKRVDFDIHLPKVFNAPLVDILEYATLLHDNTRDYLTQESKC